MMIELKAAVKRSSGTMLQDAAGLLSLIAMLLVGLNLTDLV